MNCTTTPTASTPSSANSPPPKPAPSPAKSPAKSAKTSNNASPPTKPPTAAPTRRPLRKGEILRQDQPFIVGGELKKFRRIKTERSDPKGYDPKLEMGWEYGASEVRRYHRSSITIPRAGSSLMFRKLHRYRFLKARHTDRAALVGFMGGLVADIAAQHQQGSPRRPSHLKNGLPARTLLGFSPRDLRTIEELLVSHLAGTDK